MNWQSIMKQCRGRHGRPVLLLMLSVCFFACARVEANQPVYLQMVTVGDPGNAADTNGYGACAYTFRIEKYDVTQNQYAAYLNAVAATDTYGLFDIRMQTNLDVAGIIRSGASGSYTYSTFGTGNQPICYLHWYDAARFANWMHNGQPTGAQNAATTEQGAYTLNGSTNGIILKNGGAHFWVPTADEWYKAAYYDQSLNSGAGGYWLYPTRSNVAPGNSIGGASNQANIFIRSPGPGYSVTQSTNGDATQNYLTDGGAYTGSASYYGTFDQGGNMYQWNDEVIAGTKRGLRGGSWPGSAFFLMSSYNPGVIPFTIRQDYSLRLATIATPAVNNSELAAPKINISGTNVNFTISASVLGRSYQLQSCDDLPGANWQNSGLTQVGTGNNLVISAFFNPATPRRFYRLKLF